MVLLHTVNKEVHDYLENGMVEDFDRFYKYFEYRPFKQTKSFILMAITDQELDDKRKEDFAKLKKIYNNEQFPDFKELVDKCLDHLIDKYKDSVIKLYNSVVRGGEYFSKVKKSLSYEHTNDKRSIKHNFEDMPKLEVEKMFM